MKQKTPWLAYAIIAIGVITMVFPFLDMVFTAFKGPAELMSVRYRLFPDEFRFSNFQQAVRSLNMGLLFMNSMIVSFSVTGLVLLTSTLGGYALTKLEFPGRDVIFRFILATMMFPAFLFLIPNFYIMVNFPFVNIDGGLAATRWALILPFSVSGFGVFLMRQFIMGIPNALLDAARIDGASEFRIFGQIVVPMTLPALATLAIFTFIGQWNEFIWSLLIYTVNNRLATLPVGIQMLQSHLDPTLTQALVSAGLTISVVPVFVVFVFLQKYYVRGLALSGLKE